MSVREIMERAGDDGFRGGADPGAELVEEIRDVTVRGEAIPVPWRVRRMPDGSEFLAESNGPDPMLLAREEYRRRRGWPTGSAIAEWRKELIGGTGLTQAELAAVLGFGIASLKRYENGALPTDAHARVLADAMDGGIDRMAAAAPPGALPTAKAAAFGARSEVVGGLSSLVARLLRQPADEYTGGRLFGYSRFRDLVLRLLPSPTPKTALNKRLFYADFRMYRDQGCSITGLRYARLPRGPVPDDYDTLFGLLVSEGCIAIEEVQYGPDVVGEHVASAGLPSEGALDEAELRVIQGVLKDFGRLNARAISDWSHRESAWLETGHAQHISYSHAHRLRPVVASSGRS